MSIKSRNIIHIVFLLLSCLSFSQEKLDTIYILFDSTKGDKKIANGKDVRFVFYENESIKLSTAHRLYFDLVNANQKKICFSSVETKIINSKEAIKKVDEYLNHKAIDCEKAHKDNTHCSIIRNPGLYYYNNYFKKIYLYEKTDNDNGILYEVKWNWAIE